MGTLPSEIIALMEAFRPFFRSGVWPQVHVLVIGAILAPGKRTVTAVLRTMGLSQEAQFQKYHRVLNRVKWSGLGVSGVLLRLLVQTFVPEGPILMGGDETLERRRGEKIEAKGVYRDPVRSSKSHFVKGMGLRWVCLMLIVPISWAGGASWALPFLTSLAPSQRYFQQRGRRAKTIIDWMWQMLLWVRRVLPKRELILVADGAYAVLELLANCVALHKPITVITRLRLDAALYDPAAPRTSGQRGRPRKKGARQPTLAERLTAPHTSWERLTLPWYGGRERQVELATATAVWYHSGKPPVALRWVLIRDPLGHFAPQALLCTDMHLSAALIVTYFVRRWRLEVTFQEVRAHLGVESQRQWSALAIARTTPALLALFSLVTLLAHDLLHGHPLPPRQAAWYTKHLSTFSDTLAFVRAQLWPAALFSISTDDPDMVKIPRRVFTHLSEMLAYTA